MLLVYNPFWCCREGMYKGVLIVCCWCCCRSVPCAIHNPPRLAGSPAGVRSRSTGPPAAASASGFPTASRSPPGNRSARRRQTQRAPRRCRHHRWGPATRSEGGVGWWVEGGWHHSRTCSQGSEQILFCAVLKELVTSHNTTTNRHINRMGNTHAAGQLLCIKRGKGPGLLQLWVASTTPLHACTGATIATPCCCGCGLY